MPSRRVVIDHISIGVSDLRVSRRFYLAALAPLGFGEHGAWSEDAEELAFGPEGLDDFAISTKYPVNGGGHVAFAAESREDVEAVYHQPQE
jgi:catechol 2,3-dioxygenase-like lactoylglutathione lyase family enzyme